MKPLTDTDYIHALIAEGEHQQQDFKFEISDARKIAKTLSAFANTDGGRLLIGVKDNGKIAGVRSDEEKYMIEAAAQLYCQPKVHYSMQTFHVEGRSVLVVQIEETDPIYRARTVITRLTGKKHLTLTESLLPASRYFPTGRRAFIG